MKKLSFLSLLSAIILFSSCEKPGDGSTTISGTIEGGEGPVYIFKRQPSSTVPVDTLEFENGSFKFNTMADSSHFYFIQADAATNLTLFVEPGEDVNITIKGLDKNRTYEVTGSETTKRLFRIEDIVRDTKATIDSIDQLNLAYLDSGNTQEFKMGLDVIFQQSITRSQNRLKAFIDEAPDNIANIFVFYQYIGNFPIMSPVDDMPYFEKVASGLSAAYPNDPNVIFFADRLEKIKVAVADQKKKEQIKAALVPGAAAPDIEMVSPSGEVQKLSNLKGKVVLVDFWASWCRPCRAESPNLVRMYNELKDKGFDIFSVSLDGVQQQPNPKTDWINAIQQDGLLWPNHVSDLKGWGSAAVQTFGFQGIPYTMLVDRDGSIIATELRGPALEKKILEVL